MVCVCKPCTNHSYQYFTIYSPDTTLGHVRDDSPTDRNYPELIQHNVGHRKEVSRGTWTLGAAVRMSGGEGAPE
jgi:hypothetical protein